MEAYERIELLIEYLRLNKKTVTDTYNHFNDKKIDQANRKVIDYVFKKFRKIKQFCYARKKPS